KADILEQAIAILDTAFESGDDLLLPDHLAKALGIDPGIAVPDPVYDMFRNDLHSLRPNSHIFKDITASDYEHAGRKVKHDPPMTSIAKASHEDRHLQEQMLFKWLHSISQKVQSKEWVDLFHRQNPEDSPKYNGA